jgi:hypothetical protein
VIVSCLTDTQWSGIAVIQPTGTTCILLRGNEMKKMRYAALVAMAISTLLVACEDYDNSFEPVLQERPPPPPLAWDQGNWDNVLWQ